MSLHCSVRDFRRYRTFINLEDNCSRVVRNETSITHFSYEYSYLMPPSHYSTPLSSSLPSFPPSLPPFLSPSHYHPLRPYLSTSCVRTYLIVLKVTATSSSSSRKNNPETPRESREDPGSADSRSEFL